MTGEQCNQENRLARIETAVEQLAGQVSTLVGEVKEMKSQITCLLSAVGDHQAVLYGEKGKVGMIGREAETIHTLEELKLALKGYGDEPGLIAEIKDIGRHMKGLDEWKVWIVRLVAAGIVTSVIGSVLEYFTR